MDNYIILIPVPLDSLLQSFREIVKEEIKAQQLNDQEEKLLNTQEVSDLFKVSSVTISSWVKLGKLKKYFIGGRNYFKTSEVMESLKTLQKYKS